MFLRSRFRFFSLPLALLLLLQGFFSYPLAAQTGNPVQPEFQQPAQVGADNLVDLFTGNFNYSIPLFEIGGFPMNLSYTSDHKMEEEASWVGFGWTLNPGAITRQVRGIPDDFRGDEIIHRGSMADEVTTGISPGADVEVFGAFGLSAGMNFTYNNYRGFNISYDLSPTINLAAAISGKYPEPNPRPADPMPDPDVLKNAERSKADLIKVRPAAKFELQLSANWNSTAGMSAISYADANQINQRARGTIDFGGFTYTPVGDFPRKYRGLTYSVKLGGNFWPVSVHGTYRGHTVTESFRKNQLNQPAYGYLYLQDGQADKQSILDYNNAGGGILADGSPSLPISFGTPDAFSVTGPAFAGQIKVCRNDVGIFRPPLVESNDVALSFGGDAAAGNIAHLGANINATALYRRKGGWSFNNRLKGPLRFAGNGLTHESVYMRMAGEPTVNLDTRWYNSVGREYPVAPNITNIPLVGAGVERRFTAQLSNNKEDTYGIGLPRRGATDRRARTTTVTYLTASEAQYAAVEKEIALYPLLSGQQNDFFDLDLSRNGASLPRVAPSRGRRSHHLSEIKATTATGQRFVYGLPSYNRHQQEVSFNISARTGHHLANYPAQGSSDFGTIGYQTADASTGNTRGMDNYFDETTTSGYASSFLITSVLSPDYLDRTNDGPTPDDLGQYVDFEYSALNNDPDPKLGWRTPLQKNRATFMPGNFSDPHDDKASFVYGRKEVYYPHHIDSKTHRAVFITSARQDALGVTDKNGNIDQRQRQRLRRLDEIRLYTLAELAEHKQDAKPLKTIHFTYKADVAPNDGISGDLPNSNYANGSKHTLHSVHFTYADNDRGAENPYVFSYKISNGSERITYQPFLLDRWGNQRERIDRKNPLFFPYAIQDRTQAAKFADAGNLNRIALPSGGVIDVTYEPDDYARVQHKRAGKMFRIAALLAPGETYVPGNECHNASTDCIRQLYDDDVLATRMIIEVSDPASPGSSPLTDAQVRAAYLEDVEQLYFDTEVTLRETDYCAGNCEERVSGFLPIEPGEVLVNRIDDERLYLDIPLKTVDKNNEEDNNGFQIHPMTFAALEKMRLQIPNLIYDMSDQADGISGEAILSILQQNGGIFRNFYRNSVDRGFARNIDLSKSFVRLADATKRKLGDGSRVASVTLNDRWLAGENFGGDAQTSYTKRYSYTERDPITGRSVSTGVAANEPMIGKSENLLVNVDRTPDERFLAPNNNYYTETPAGLQFYPAPRVGYASVTVTTELDEAFKQSKPGYSTTKFYTASDYPVITRSTEVDRKRGLPVPQVLPTISTYFNHLGLSQGYAIEVNDMHGKMKGSEEYNAMGDLISSSEYFYRSLPAPDTEEPRLDNLVETVTKDNELKSSYLGQEVDYWLEMQATESTSGGIGVQGQVDFGFAGPFPVAVPSAYPNLTTSIITTRSAVATKLISKYAILDSVRVMNNGATLVNKNRRWEALTGQPTLTETQNEFDQTIYSHTLPAYHLKEFGSMGPAYLNEGVRFPFRFIRNGRILGDGNGLMERVFYPGDEVALWEVGLLNLATKIRRAWVVPAQETGSTQLYLVDEGGNLIESRAGSYLNLSFFTGIITRSGRRNMMGASAQQTVSLRPPNDLNFWQPGTKNTVLSSTATHYSDRWGNQCLPPPDVTVNTLVADCASVRPGFMTMVRSLFDVDDCRECSVRAYDFSEAETLQQLVECELCDDLFRIYSENGWIKDPGNLYGDCQQGAPTPAQRTAIENCSFITRHPWMTQSNGIFIKSRDGNGTVTNNYGAGCADHPCNTDPSSPINVVYQNGTNQEPDTTFALAVNCFPFQLIDVNLDDDPDNNSIDPGNPYFDGRRGNWRAQSVYTARVGERLRTGLPGDQDTMFTQQPALYRDGTIVEYDPFWRPEGLFQEGNSHQFTSQTLAYDDAGNGLESIDAIGVKSAVQTAYHRQLQVAVAQNAAQTEIAYESYEDYNYLGESTPADTWTRHFSFTDDIQPTTDHSHTGLYALPVAPGAAIQQSYATSNCPVGEICDTDDACACRDAFAPSTDKRYVVSAWVANTLSLANGYSPARMGGDAGAGVGMQAQYAVNGSVVSTSPTFGVSGTVIEGWQRLYGEITIPAGATDVILRITTPGTSAAGTSYYVDDVRFHPYETNMVTYAYNPETLRLMAQMDENGYATFFEYDDEGMLIRQKRETERGVMTISEQRSNVAVPND